MTSWRHDWLIVLLRLLTLHLALRRGIVTLRQLLRLLLLIALLRWVGDRVGELLVLWLLLNDHHLPVGEMGW